MKKLRYRVRRRYGAYAPGDEVQLTEAEATQLENEAPGLLEGPLGAVPAAPAKPAPKPTKDDV